MAIPAATDGGGRDSCCVTRSIRCATRPAWSVWLSQDPIPVAASTSLLIQRSPISTASIRSLAGSLVAASFSRRSVREIAFGAFIDETASLASGLRLSHRGFDRCESPRGTVRLLRPEQDPVPQVRLARFARRTRRPLLLSGRRRARSRGAGLCRRELRQSGAAFQSCCD